jgi:L-ascorbate metabolism protein UlaG (beta-lactamase superfamily)
MVQVTFLGHSGFLVNVEGAQLLFDPFISGNDQARDKIDLASLNPDYILLTHGHQDHVLDAQEIARQSGATIISNFEVANWFAEKGVEKTHPLNHGGGVDLPFGRIQYVNAVHTSSMPDGSYGGQPGGFVITHSKGAFYHCGDTALHMDMKLIPMRTKLDFAILCIGDNFTMDAADAADAAVAADFVEVTHVIGMHYDTFPPIEIEHDKAKKTFSDRGKELILMEIGQTIDMNIQLAKAV